MALDQLTKHWATQLLEGRLPVEVIGNFFHLTYHRNTGGVFGLLAGPPTTGRRLFFVVATVLALALIVYFLKEWGHERPLTLTALSLIIGGALGNLIDRVVYGEVIDFIDWHWHDHHWPAFNIADSAITVGTLILLGALLTAPKEGVAT